MPAASAPGPSTTACTTIWPCSIRRPSPSPAGLHVCGSGVAALCDSQRGCCAAAEEWSISDSVSTVWGCAFSVS
ncbi:hypothetical protein BJD12_07625 [Xanthomonas vesicatoria ATCC 35937]|nr:hypothetical protein BJD12_07625 [Xanthomonas vesicatoria ATCC 35937]